MNGIPPAYSEHMCEGVWALSPGMDSGGLTPERVDVLGRPRA